MSKTTNIFVLAAISSVLAGTAMAQTTAFANDGAASDAVDDIEEDIADERDRDINFGNDGREVGSYGSLAFRGSSTSSDGDTSAEASVGLRYGTFDGVNGFDVTASFSYSDNNGTADDTNQLLVGADYRRDFGPSLFAYAKADASFNKEATDADTKIQDIFVGAGLGYRIFNDATTQWSIQAGPGYRSYEQKDGLDVDEAAASISNNVFYSLTETAYVTNDTDVIYSDSGTTVNNELALSVSLTDTLSLRTSYTTVYDDQTDDTFSDATNTFGASVVYNFN